MIQRSLVKRVPKQKDQVKVKGRGMRIRELRRKDPAQFTPEEARLWARAEEKAQRRQKQQEDFARWIAMKPEEDRTEREKALLWKVERRVHLRDCKLPGESLKEHILRLQQKPEIERSSTEDRLVRQWERRLYRLHRRKHKQHKQKDGEGEAASKSSESEVVISWARNPTTNHSKKISPKQNHCDAGGVLSIHNVNALMKRMDMLGLSSEKLKAVEANENSTCDVDMST